MEVTPLETSPERRAAWIQIRPDILWSLIWVQTIHLNRFLQAIQSTQVQITKSSCINGDNSVGDITRASNGLDPDQARYFVKPVAIFYDCTARLVTNLVGNPKDRFFSMLLKCLTINKIIPLTHEKTMYVVDSNFMFVRF